MTTENKNAVYAREYPALKRLAYRMLGTAGDAEDVVQEAYLRWSKAKLHDPLRAHGYLKKVVMSLCIDELRLQKRARETYPGPWLPEPIPDDEPHVHQDLLDELSSAFLLMLEKLSPPQRAVFILREAMDHSFKEVAEVLDISETNARQLLSRAKKHLAGSRRPFRTNPDEHRRLLEAFLGASQRGDAGAMAQLLAKDAVYYGDGGGKRPSVSRPLTGREPIIKLILGLMARYADVAASGDLSVVPVPVNGTWGLATIMGGELDNVVTIASRSGLIDQIFVVRNPDKLRAIEAYLGSRTEH